MGQDQSEGETARSGSLNIVLVLIKIHHYYHRLVVNALP
jgi:hypothetical protein